MGRIAVTRSGALLALLVAACGRESSKATRDPDKPRAALSSAAASAPPPAESSGERPLQRGPTSSVQLLDAGRAPRRTLRYRWRADRKERMTIELSTKVSAEGSGGHQDIELAPMQIAVAVEPSGLSKTGDLSFAWHVVSAALATTDASSPPAVAQGWSAQLAPLEHLAGTGSISPEGLSQGVSVDAPGTAEAGVDGEMVVQVVQMIRDVTAPLPEEPVGVGARWQKMTVLEGNTGHARQTDTFTLTDVQGDTGTLDDVLAQTATPQAFGGRGPAATPTARMDQLLTSGQAKIAFNLTRIVPQSVLDGTTSMSVSGATQRMNMILHLAVTVHGTAP